MKSADSRTNQRERRRSWAPLWLVGATCVVVFGGCSGSDGGGGFDILAEGERNPDPIEVDADNGVATEPDEAGSQPTATPGPSPEGPAATPTALPTPTLVPTATPVPTPTATATPRPTPTPLPDLPIIEAPTEVRAEVGNEVDTGISVVFTAANPVETAELDPAPPGAVGLTSFRPPEPGTWQVDVVVVDSFGRESRHPVTFVARHPKRDDAVVAMGDSVASGHGLDLRDYLGRDSCFRSNGGYPKRVRDALVRAGDLPSDTEVALVACSGADSDDLFSRLVTGGVDGTEPSDGNRRTQLDWAIQANPALILMTAGINDIGFVNPTRLISGGQLSTELIEPRLAATEADLSHVLDELVDKTDATIVVTDYYNPTAQRPQGIDGCETDCFYAVTQDAVERLNAAIERSLPASDRVVFVELADLFIGHGAPNGLGPDGLREGAGLFGDLLGDYTQGIQAYCAKGDSRGDPWVNAIDCVHPTEEGSGAIASAIISAVTRSAVLGS